MDDFLEVICPNGIWDGDGMSAKNNIFKWAPIPLRSLLPLEPLTITFFIQSTPISLH